MSYSKSILFLGVFLLVGFWFFAGPSVNRADAFTCTAATSTLVLSWNSTTSWVNCNGTIPQIGDDVIIGGGNGTSDPTRITADVTSTVASITINSNASTSTITFGTNITLTVTGGVTVNGPDTNNIPKNITVGTSSNHLSIGGNLNIGGTTSSRQGKVTASTGTLTVGAGVTFTGGTNSILETTGAATVNLAGTIGSGGTVSINSGSTVNFTATAATNGAYTYPVTNVNAGTLTIGGATVFTGAVTVASGAAWSNTGNNAVEFRNGFINNSGGTISMGTGTQTFSTNSQALDGTDSITFGGAAAISGAITLTNNNDSTVTVSGAITGTVAGSTWTQGTNSTLAVAGAVLATGTLTTSASGNTVNYNGVDQTVKLPSSNYVNLTISGSGTARFTSSSTYSTTGALTISNAVNINSSDGSTQWFITHTGTESVNAGTISFSGCTASQEITVTTGTEGASVDACWAFPVVAADLSWDNSTATNSFSIWAGSTPTSDAVLTWANGTKICETGLSDDNTRFSVCGTLNKSQKYRIQMILKNTGGAAANMNGSGEPVDQRNVKAHWAGSNPTIAASTDCGFRDFGGDNGSTTCNVAFNATNNVRVTNTGAGDVVIADTSGTEGFMYLITTDTDIPLSNPSTYASASIDTITEDSSRVTIGLKRVPGLFIRGKITIRGKVMFR
ncbi:MAG TPA: hypothetical protein VJ046_02300 [Candidatus Paceibacterota bacterium]|nr:hypothetical protein [Candidatus Paceibacterota bacterium]